MQQNSAKRQVVIVSNAEVLGLNVIDSMAATWANFIGLTTPLALGGISGVAAVVGVDAIRNANAVSAGKRGTRCE